jgi:hypothetical protein
MIQLAPNMTIFVAVEPVDGRRQIDGLAALCRERLGADPMSGAVYVFTNKGRTSIRALCFDGHGWWLCSRRFSRGKVDHRPKAVGDRLHPIAAHELSVLLYNGNPRWAHFSEPWRKVG